MRELSADEIGHVYGAMDGVDVLEVGIAIMVVGGVLLAPPVFLAGIVAASGTATAVAGWSLLASGGIISFAGMMMVGCGA